MGLYAEALPGSHLLEKRPGPGPNGLITAEWVVFNDDGPAFARLELVGLPHPTDVIIVTGQRVAVPAGTPAAPGEALLRVTHTLAAGLGASGPHTVTLTMRQVDTAGESVAVVRSHQWFLTVLGGAVGGAVIRAVGDPVIV